MKKYNVMCFNNSTEVVYSNPVKGRIDNVFGRDVIVHREIEGGGWTVTDFETGFEVVTHEKSLFALIYSDLLVSKHGWGTRIKKAKTFLIKRGIKLPVNTK